MKIKITLADIRKAKAARARYMPNRSRTCPLAVALRRILKRDDISVGYFMLLVGTQVYNLTTKVSNFIDETDEKKDKIRPRELEIDLTNAPTTTTST